MLLRYTELSLENDVRFCAASVFEHLTDMKCCYERHCLTTCRFFRLYCVVFIGQSLNHVTCSG